MVGDRTLDAVDRFSFSGALKTSNKSRTEKLFKEAAPGLSQTEIRRVCFWPKKLNLLLF